MEPVPTTEQPERLLWVPHNDMNGFTLEVMARRAFRYPTSSLHVKPGMRTGWNILKKISIYQLPVSKQTLTTYFSYYFEWDSGKIHFFDKHLSIYLHVTTGQIEWERNLGRERVSDRERCCVLLIIHESWERWLLWQRKLKESSITELSMYSLFECIFSAGIMGLMHISTDLLYIRCESTHKLEWGLAQHDSQEIWAWFSDLTEQLLVAHDRSGLTFSGWGRKTFIDCILRQQRDDIEPAEKERDKKKTYNTINLRCQPMRNNSRNKKTRELIDTPRRRTHTHVDTHMDTHGQLLMLWRLFVSSRCWD